MANLTPSSSLLRDSAGKHVTIATCDDGSGVHTLKVSEHVTLVAATLTRPADTTPYASGDLMANSTTAGSVTPMTFTNVGRATGNGGRIKRARMSTSSTSVTNAQFRLHLYTTSPTVTNGDNGAWLSNQAATYVGFLDITIDKAMSDGAAGVAGFTAGAEVLFTAVTLYGLLEARAAYTPTSAGTFTVTLEVAQN